MKLSEILNEQIGNDIEWPEDPKLGIGTHDGWIAFYCHGEDTVSNYTFNPDNFWCAVGYADEVVGKHEFAAVTNQLKGSNSVFETYKSLNDDFVYIGSDTYSVLPNRSMVVCLAFERTEERLKAAVLKIAQTGVLSGFNKRSGDPFKNNPEKVFDSKFLIMFPTKLAWDYG